jgi:hypothetical protein
MGILLDEGIELFINYSYHGNSGSLHSDILIILTHSIFGWKENCRTMLWVIPVEDNRMMANRGELQLNGDFKPSYKLGSSYIHKILSWSQVQK